MTRLREELASPALLEVRTDSAFFQRDFLESCDRLGVEYALKVPMWHYLNLRGLVKTVDPSLWQTVSRVAQVEGIFLQLEVPFWNRSEHIAIYRTRRSHKPVKGTDRPKRGHVRACRRHHLHPQRVAPSPSLVLRPKDQVLRRVCAGAKRNGRSCSRWFAAFCGREA